MDTIRMWGHRLQQNRGVLRLIICTALLPMYWALMGLNAYQHENHSWSGIIAEALASKDLSPVTTALHRRFDMKPAAVTCPLCPARVYCIPFSVQKILSSTS